MELLPTLRALARRKSGVALSLLQIALTVGILSNALAIVQQRLQHMQAPSGVDEADVFTMTNQFVGPALDLSARIQGDLAVLRSIPGVVDAAAMQSFPLRGYGASTFVKLHADQQQPTANVASYAATPGAMHTLGVRIIAGREFTPTEVRELRFGIDRPEPAVTIITQSLARRLFPRGDALGQVIYVSAGQPSRVVGIVAEAAEPWAGQANGDNGLFGTDWSVFLPYQWVSPYIAYVVRTRPGMSARLLPVAERRLMAFSRARVLSEAQTFAETRAEQYRTDRSLGLILAVVCVALLLVTAMGLVALTTSWMVQRRRQIGMRRALGARRTDILWQFQFENLLISLGGAALGCAVALIANVWLEIRFSMQPLGVRFLLLGAAVVLALGQLAVLWPALRASAVPPTEAMRSA